MGKKNKAKIRRPRFPHKCARCELKFTSRKKLKLHSKKHLQLLEELKMLEEGHVPQESKIGERFKGKNKIIIS